MPSDEIKKLESLDLSKITLADLKSLKNSVMRQALLQMIGALGETVQSPQHTSHGMHTNHLKSIVLPTDFNVDPALGGSK